MSRLANLIPAMPFVFLGIALQLAFATPQARTCPAVAAANAAELDGHPTGPR